MSLQLAELEALKEFLTKTENRISLMSAPVIQDEAVLQEQLEEQQQLHEDILKEQERVVSFSNLVVVVDESNPDTEYANIEDQLSALSERWSHICSWTEKRGRVLMKLIEGAPQHLERLKGDLFYNFCQFYGKLDLILYCADLEGWLQAQERTLREVEANPNENTEDSLLDRYEKLQALQTEMEEKMREIGELQTALQNISDECQRESGESLKSIGDGSDLSPSGIGSEPIMEKIELLQDRWDALSQILEAQSQRVRNICIYDLL